MKDLVDFALLLCEPHEHWFVVLIGSHGAGDTGGRGSFDILDNKGATIVRLLLLFVLIVLATDGTVLHPNGISLLLDEFHLETVVAVPLL